jgi:hypothetical protein
MFDAGQLISRGTNLPAAEVLAIAAKSQIEQ